METSERFGWDGLQKWVGLAFTGGMFDTLGNMLHSVIGVHDSGGKCVGLQ